MLSDHDNTPRHFVNVLIFLFILLISSINVVDAFAGNHSIFSQRSQAIHNLFNLYDKRLPPFFESDNTFQVRVQLFIERINYIDDLNMSGKKAREPRGRLAGRRRPSALAGRVVPKKKFVMTLFVRLYWIDPRLKLEKLKQLSMDPLLADHIWKPDIYFSNEEDGYTHDQLGRNELVTLYNNGSLFYSRRVTINFDCKMDFHNYPFDEQLCPTDIQSYSFSQDDMIVKWHDHAINWNRKPKSIRYDIEGYKFGECPQAQWVTGNFSCLNFAVHMRRDRSYYYIQVFLPSGLIVVLSWIGFWINYDAVPARLSLSVITVLTISTQTGDVRTQLPPVSYVKALDVWMSVCLIMVFASLVEFAIVNVINRQTAKVRRRQENLLPNIQAMEEHFLKDGHCCGSCTAANVDKIARLAFPSVFTIFNIIYWSYYLTVSDDKSQMSSGLIRFQ